MSDLSFELAYSTIYGSAILGLIFGYFNYYSVVSIEVKAEGKSELLEPLIDGNQDAEKQDKPPKPAQLVESLKKISDAIAEGASAFLDEEYKYIAVFITLFGIVIFLCDGYKIWTVLAFVVGALTSLLCGYIGMSIAVKTNYRVAFQAAFCKDQKERIYESFNAAFRGGSVMGFCLVSISLAVLSSLIILYKRILSPTDVTTFTHMFEYLAGYGLGGSTVALFCRVGGGIFTKAADVGADLAGKVEADLAEDSPENPAVIADNVGDNVGDIAGMGSDLFGSFAESTCAALVVSGTSVELINGPEFLYPLVLSSTGIIVCIITALFATHVMKVEKEEDISRTLAYQLYISTLLLLPTIFVVSYFFLPAQFSFITGDKTVLLSGKYAIMICAMLGLVSGLLIGGFTDYYTSNEYKPTQELAKSCVQGAAINIIQGLALGYLSTVIPIISIASNYKFNLSTILIKLILLKCIYSIVTIFVSFTYAGMYGIAIAALGMLSNLAISLAIDAYGPISDNAGGLAEMSQFPKSVRKITDKLDAAGNTTAAIGKGFAIGSACLVSLALFGAFITRTKLTSVNILEPIQISCLIFGAMIPYAFSALTMKSVGVAAQKMVEEVREQFKQRAKDRNNFKPDHKRCVAISTDYSLKEMILPGVIVIFTPLSLGILFGPKAVSGYLAGVIVSGVQMAISASNSGGSWDNAKKYIEAEKLPIEGSNEFYKKKSEPHKAAVVGDTVGDPLKDTSGPSLNILIKLSAIVSLIFGSFFAEYSFYKV